MGIIDGLKNTFISKVLNQVLDGNKGSNILTVIITAIIGANLDYMKAFRGFKFENPDEVSEAAKLVGVLVLAIYGYFIGKRDKK